MKNLFTTNNKKYTGKSSHLIVGILAIIILVASGEIYRVTTRYFNRITGTSINLPVGLSNIPYEIGNWAGNAVEIPENIRIYMETYFADDYISRRYHNKESGLWADLYVVYCATKPGGMLGHRPSVCYPGNGWVHDETKETTFTTKNEKVVKCLIHKFHKPAPDYRHTIVLNFYIINGRLSTKESDFSGFSARKVNLSGNPTRYSAQVQISSVSESSILAAAEDIVEMILDFFPDENGIVRSTEMFENDSILK